MGFRNLGRIIWIFGGMTLFIASNAYALYEDKIYLHDGSSIKGEIVGSESNVSFTLKRRDGSIREFKMEDVWKVEFEEEDIYEDRVYLKDGSVIIGTIIGAIPRETYRIRTQDGSTLAFKMGEVSRVEFKTPVPISEPKPLSEPKSPVTPTPLQPPTLTTKPKIEVSIGPWLGLDWASMEEIDGSVKKSEDDLKEWATDEKTIKSERTEARRGMGFGGDLGIKINPNIGLLGRIGFLRYPEFGLEFYGETINCWWYTPIGLVYGYGTRDLALKFKPSLMILAGGLSFSHPIGANLSFDGEGLLGYGWGTVKENWKDTLKVVEAGTGDYIQIDHDHQLEAKGGGFLFDFGGGLGYSPSPMFSLIGRVGYKLCKIEEMEYKAKCKVCDKDKIVDIENNPIPFDFGGLNISGGFKLSF